MGAIQKIGALLGYEPRGVSAYVQLIDPSTGVIQTFNEFAVAPSIRGNELMRVLQMIFDADSHLEGLYRRISIALLSSKIQITCDDATVEQYVKERLGIVEGAPPTRFLRYMNELTSSLQYGFSLHEKSLVNEDGGSRIRLRRIEPVDVYEFTVEGDELVSVAEAYSENVHGGNVTRRKIRSSVDGKDMEVVDIPKDDLLHIAPLQLGRNYWGRSIFRSAIGTSAYKVIYMYCDAIRQGRFSVPWLIGKLDKFDQRSSEDVSVLSKVMKMPATAIDRMLLFRKEDEIQAISPSGGTNILESVRYIDFSNSKLVLEQFVDVGDKAWGSRSTYSGAATTSKTALTSTRWLSWQVPTSTRQLSPSLTSSTRPPCESISKRWAWDDCVCSSSGARWSPTRSSGEARKTSLSYANEAGSPSTSSQTRMTWSKTNLSSTRSPVRPPSRRPTVSRFQRLRHEKYATHDDALCRSSYRGRRKHHAMPLSRYVERQKTGATLPQEND